MAAPHGQFTVLQCFNVLKEILSRHPQRGLGQWKFLPFTKKRKGRHKGVPTAKKTHQL